MKMRILSVVVCLTLAACASATVSPGPTLWLVINNYHDEMRTLESRPELWPDRQRLAESIKITYLATFGGSKEFNRLVDLDLRRREFLIALRRERLTPERTKEIQQEVVALNQQIDILQPSIKAQMMAAQLRPQEPSQPIESVATLGLLNLAIDEFSAGGSDGKTLPATKVGPYTVTGRGLFSEVLTPDGRMFRCATTLLSEQGASISCEPLSSR